MVFLHLDSDLKDTFYDNFLLKHRRKNGRILILAATDVDSVCAVKILLHLLSCDGLDYSLSVCVNTTDAAEAVKNVRDTVRTVIMINCGATENILETLQPRGTTRFCVLDNRRPVNLENFHDRKQVCLLMDASESESIPRREQFVADEDDSQEERDLEEQRFEDKQKRMEDETYYTSTWFSGSSAVALFKLAHLLNKDDVNLFFWGIVGLCDIHMQHKIDKAKFVQESTELQGDMMRLRHSIDENNLQSFRITFTSDLSLHFYRQWAIFDSLSNTPYTTARFRTWENKGEKQLLALLADMGFKLMECKQSYSAMDLQIRENMFQWFKDMTLKYNIPDIIDSTFLATYGFNQKFQVRDMSLGLFSSLTINDENSSEENFHAALNALSESRVHQITDILEMGKTQLLSLRSIVQAAFEEKLYVAMNTYMLLSLDNLSTASIRYVGRPHVLIPLTHFLQETYVAISGRKTRNVPFVLVAQLLPPNPERSDCVHLVGLAPLGSKGKNPMGNAFRKTAQMRQIELAYDSFDDFLIRIKKSDQKDFLDGLIIVLAAPLL